MPYPELEELYNTYRTDLYRYLCHLTHDPAEAEDLLSETFLRALRRLHTYRGDCAVKTWLFGIAHNVWLESLRKRRPTVSADDLLETYLTDAPCRTTPTPACNGSGYRHYYSKKMTVPAAWCSCGHKATAMPRSPRGWASAKVRLASSSTAPAPG